MSSSSLNGQSNTKGMPTGIPFIIGNEAAERFSYYGMKTILAVFMTNYLMMTDNVTTEWFHNFSSALYFLPIFGAIASDLFFGKYRIILWLSIVYCLGHLVLALNETQDGLMWGLTLIAIGSGGIKPCVSAHVGDQFDESNKHLVSKVFSYFYFAINFGSFFSTLLIPVLLESYGPSVAFGLPGVLMMLATFVFWLGRRRFVHIPARPKLFKEEFFSKNFLKIVLRLGLIYLFISVFWSLYDQTGSSWVIQASSNLMDKSVNLGFMKLEVLPSQIQALNPFFVMILIPLFTMVLYPAIEKKIKIKPLLKVCAGMFMCAFSFFIISHAESMMHNGETVSILWQLFAYVVLTAGEVMLYLTAMEYSYTQAPVSMKSVIMGLFLMSISLGNFTTSTINKFLVDDYPVKNIVLSDHLVIDPVESFGLESGDKLNINHDFGLVYQDGKKESPLLGTFLIGKQDSGYVIWNKNRNPIEVKLKAGLDKLTLGSGNERFSYYKLNGPAYFDLFAWMMVITAILFIPFALTLKYKAYIQKVE